MSEYSKYLEYLQHVDDTTREDMLSREAAIREEVKVAKERMDYALECAKKEMESRIAAAESNIDKEKERAAQIIAAKGVEHMSELKEQREEIERKYEEIVGKLREQNNKLTKKSNDLKASCEEIIEKQRNEYEDQLMNQKAFYETEIRNLKKRYEERLNDYRSSRRPSDLLTFIGEQFKCFADRLKKALGAISNIKVRQFVLSRKDFEENKWGAIGYTMALTCVLLFWAPYVPIVCSIAAFWASFLGLADEQAQKASYGLCLSVLGFVLGFIMHIVMGW